MISFYFLLFFIYAVLGWLVEVFSILVVDKKFVNRGFLIGPYCPIYGVGALSIMFFEPIKANYILTIFLIIISISIIEYFSSFFMEKIFKIRWWDYSNRRLNINGRICLINIIIFAIFGILFLYFLNPLFKNLLNFYDNFYINLFSILFLIIIVTDALVSYLIIKRIKLSDNDDELDDTEELTNKIKNFLFSKSIYRNRINKAFPDFKKLQDIRKKEKMHN